MYKQLGSRKGELLETLSHSEEQQLSQIQAQIQRYKRRKDVTSHDIQELEALRDQKDPLLFTKVPNSLSLSSDTAALELVFACTMLILLSKCLLQGLTKIQARIRKPVPEKAAVKLPKPPIILDESTKEAILTLFQQFILDIDFSGESLPARAHLTFTPCHTRAFHVDDKELSVIPCLYGQRTTYTDEDFRPIYSTQSFSEGWHFWEVDTSHTTHWKLGVTHQTFHCYLQMDGRNLSVFLGCSKITEKAVTTAISMVRVELDCRRNTVSFCNMSNKDGVLAKRHQLIQTVNIPASYPVHADFSISSGYLRLL
ncbi:uncharacterized protein LOC118159093 isoform X1 [Oxyura jamaicensis]|uniref:uncharacterized protein LOC118159093 isoform X1 n=1 Tax=Oxyura jamaicensis TaxID=8884 RepID=UPI0015A51A41|nr:uncharacterized protein LOC118159093 isoform X1 [Oxyura jamaicensis]